MLVESQTPDSINRKKMVVVIRNADAKRKVLGSSSNFRNLVKNVARSSTMKNLFKPKKPRTPVDVIQETRAIHEMILEFVWMTVHDRELDLLEDVQLHWKYVDPGKWATTVDGGARFSSYVVLLMLIFNCVAILCQYLSACIAVVTGKDLAQILGNEESTNTYT
ncbi:unnamed protein product [Fraxinus pennsylvanica]|uniref:Uncharacterized protein n=1 Tax=Fraxinus pennsylvanica TaxID=56036 RepID=A0AAD2AA32_9LAMI|nr:unnamed protein product [Fraxinus pennsylvanica]